MTSPSSGQSGQSSSGQSSSGPHASGQPTPGSGAADSRAEQVLSQALRVMAGGGKAAPPSPSGGPERGVTRRLTTGQLILLAAIVGLLIGIGAGFISLML